MRERECKVRPDYTPDVIPLRYVHNKPPVHARSGTDCLRGRMATRNPSLQAHHPERADARAKPEIDLDDQKQPNKFFARLSIWTHWDLNPGPSACEADVIPLHHVPNEEAST